MQKFFIILLLLFCNSCKKEGTVKPYSLVSVKFIDDEDYVFMETTEGSCDKIQKMAQLNATGYKNERFGLYLDNLIDTGYTPKMKGFSISFFKTLLSFVFRKIC